MDSSLYKNVRRNYLYTFLNNFNLTNGIWMLYLAYKGLSLFEIGIMEAIFHLASFTMEVPTGIVADLYGRKTSRMLGRLVAVASTCIMIFASDVRWFAVSFILSAIGYNLESGAGDALVYDSMKEVGAEQSYMKTVGIREICFQLARTLSLLLGGYLAKFDYMLVYKFALVVGVVTLLHSFTFKEPSIGKVKSEHKGFKLAVEQVKSSLSVIMGERKIAFLIVANEVFALFYTTEFFYIQNHMKGLGHTEFEIGIVLAAGALGGAFVSSQTHKLDSKFGSRKVLMTALFMGILGFWAVALPSLLAPGFIYLAFVEGMLFVSTSDYINRLIPSEQRATILSCQSMVFSFLMILLFPLVGKVGDWIGLAWAFKGIALLATLTLTALAAFVFKSKKEWATLEESKQMNG